MTPAPDPALAARRLVYGLLITLAAGLTAGRIASVERLHEPSVHKVDGSDVPRPAWPAKRPTPSPTFGSNDRSRWAAARALVEKGTFVVGQRNERVTPVSGTAVLAARDPVEAVVLLHAGYHARIAKENNTGIIFEDGYESVDKVMHPDTLAFYSTKPPLMALLLAGEYWVLKKSFGWSMEKDNPHRVEHTFYIVRIGLVVFNLVPLVVYLLLLAWLAERFAQNDWSRYFIVGAGGFATMLTPFLVTINNHTPAVLGVTVVVVAVVSIAENGARWWHFVLCGLASGFTVCMELPALALAAGVFAYLAGLTLLRMLGSGDSERGVHLLAGLALFVLGALVFPAVMVAANYWQLSRLTPAYAEFGGPWYQYEGSHWRIPEGMKPKRGIDFARLRGETRAEYAFHLLIGHHGVFSLMPVMLLAVAGMAMGVVRLASGRRQHPETVASGGRKPPESGAFAELSTAQGANAPRSLGDAPGANAARAPLLGLLCLFSLLVSLVVIGFYLFRSDNYGGWCNGPRWLMWLAPLWLVCMLPVLDVLARRRAGRWLALALLLLSILSMSYQNWSPWRHPWIYNWLESMDRIHY